MWGSQPCFYFMPSAHCLSISHVDKLKISPAVWRPKPLSTFLWTVRTGSPRSIHLYLSCSVALFNQPQTCSFSYSHPTQAQSLESNPGFSSDCWTLRIPLTLIALHIHVFNFCSCYSIPGFWPLIWFNIVASLLASHLAFLPSVTWTDDYQIMLTQGKVLWRGSSGRAPAYQASV
jgi:hypothetical protein